MKHVFLMGAIHTATRVLQFPNGAEILPGVANKGAHKVHFTHDAIAVTPSQNKLCTEEQMQVTATGQV